MAKLKIRNSILLFIAAFIWGSAFVAQSVGMEYIGPYTFSATRSFLGSGFLFLFLILRKFLFPSASHKILENASKNNHDLIISGIVCGCILFVSMNLQQVGILYTSVGKSGFLTALYIVLVPLFGIFLGKTPGKKLILAVIFAVTGLYLLCMNTNQMQFAWGDVLLLLCAVSFSFHILAVDHFCNRVDGVKLSCLQFLVCGSLSAILMLIFEQPSLTAVLDAGLSVFYAGILSSGIAYTLQIVGQKGQNPTVASLIMSLESVISAISGWIVLGQVLSRRELTGCVVMFAAIILAQLPEKSSD